MEAVEERRHLPFDLHFQQQLFRILLEDDGFALAMGHHVQPFYFANEVLSWAWGFCQKHHEKYSVYPGFPVLFHQVQQMEASQRQIYATVIDTVQRVDLRDGQWLRDQVLDFVRRNIFVRAFKTTHQMFQAGKEDKSYDFLMGRLEEVQRATWEVRDRSFFCGDLDQREDYRNSHDVDAESIPTGFPWLDHVLDGGLSLGEVGSWVAYPKIGKTTMLIQHGVASVALGWRKTYHAVLEGSRRLVENRYDARFMDETYNRVKRGNIDAEKYKKTRLQYEQMKDLLVIEGFTERWDYTIKDIDSSLKDLRIRHGWVPEMIIIDYGDLLSGRNGPYRNHLESEISAFRDIKSLANRGYALWTASQAQRPKEGADEKLDLLKSRQIAGVYEKVRICDYLGTLNQTLEEERNHIMRLYAEIYRDNAAGGVLSVRSDLAKMTIEELPGLVNPSVSNASSGPGVNYGAGPKQRRAPL